MEWDVARAEKGGFDDFMLKEIHDQPTAIRDTLVGRVSEHGLLALDELHTDTDVLREIDKVFVVACGTAFHSGLVAKYAIEHWARLACRITGAPTSAAADITACTCSRLLTLKAGMP